MKGTPTSLKESLALQRKSCAEGTNPLLQREKRLAQDVAGLPGEEEEEGEEGKRSSKAAGTGRGLFARVRSSLRCVCVCVCVCVFSEAGEACAKAKARVFA